MITDRLISQFTKALRIENTVEKDEAGDLYLVTSCYLNTPRPVYRHAMPLTPLLAELESRYDLTPVEDNHAE